MPNTKGPIGPAIPLRDYIETNYSSQRAFAEAIKVNPQQLTKWLKGEWIVVDGALYSKRRMV